jgi:hypothetical protein
MINLPITMEPKFDQDESQSNGSFDDVEDSLDEFRKSLTENRKKVKEKWDSYSNGHENDEKIAINFIYRYDEDLQVALKSDLSLEDLSILDAACEPGLNRKDPDKKELLGEQVEKILLDKFYPPPYNGFMTNITKLYCFARMYQLNDWE